MAKNSSKKPLNKKQKRQIKLILLKILLIFLIVLCTAVIGVVIVFHHYYSKMNIDKGNIDMVTTEFVEEDIDPNATDSDADLILSVDEQLKQNLEDSSTELMFSDNVYNILLIGNDSRDKNTLGRSDSMIIVSINKSTKEIILTSIMRDSYVYIPGHWNTRINAAYALGGPDLLIETIETNFKVKIDSYVAVNFFSFMDAVDAVGGVEIEVSNAEANVLNTYIAELNYLEGLPEGTDMLYGGGTYKLNGKQALAYSRIRYVGNADFDRTGRQREVLEKMMNSMRTASLSELNNVLNVVLPQVTTDISEGEMFTLLLDTTTTYKDYAIKQYRVPYDGTYQNLTIDGAAVLGLDLMTNINYLHRDIYGD